MKVKMILIIDLECKAQGYLNENMCKTDLNNKISINNSKLCIYPNCATHCPIPEKLDTR